MSALGERNIIIDGCITVAKNMQIRELLRYPKTHYTVMTRDYTDMLWAAYNFWCKPDYDGPSCKALNYWTDSAVHQRSAQVFHELIQADQNHTARVIQPFWHPSEKPCIHARNFYSGYYKYLHNHNLNNDSVIIVASEELDLYPLQVAQRVADFVQYDISNINLSGFRKVRVNTQENKGAGNSISADKYLPGLYSISNYQPVLPESRALINQCWYEDCIALSKIPPYYKYTACHPELKSNGTLLL